MTSKKGPMVMTGEMRKRKGVFLMRPRVVLPWLVVGWFVLAGVPGLRAQKVAEAGAPRRPTAAIERGVPIGEWQWVSQRFLPLRTPEPAVVTETFRVVIAARGDSFVRVDYEIKPPSTGFASGAFRGASVVRYAIGYRLAKITRRAGQVVAQAAQPLGLLDAEPAGHKLAEFSVLGGLERGRSVAVSAAAALEGENVFAISGQNLVFLNHDPMGTPGRGFPARIVLEPVK